MTDADDEPYGGRYGLQRRPASASPAGRGDVGSFGADRALTNLRPVSDFATGRVPSFASPPAAETAGVKNHLDTEALEEIAALERARKALA